MRRNPDWMRAATGTLRQGRRGGDVGKSSDLAVGEGGFSFRAVLSHVASVVKESGLTARSVLAMPE